MQHHRELDNVRMPLTRKRGRPSYGRPARRGRRPKAQTTEDQVLQASQQYYESVSRIPNMASYSMPPSSQINNNNNNIINMNYHHVHQSPYPAYSHADPRIRLQAEREQTSRYYQRIQTSKRSSTYIPTEQTNMGLSAAGQALYPTNFTHTVPEQLPERSCMTTNSSTLPAAAPFVPPTLLQYYTNSTRIPEPVHKHVTQQMRSPPPHPPLVTRPASVKTTQKECQTEFSMTDDIEKLHELLISKKMDCDQLEIKATENGEIDVIYQETNLRADLIKELEPVSNKYKEALLNMFQVHQAMQNSNDTINDPVVPLHTVQDARYEIVSSAEESFESENSDDNASNALPTYPAANILPQSANVANTLPAHQQMPQQANMSPDFFQQYPIPTTYNEQIMRCNRQAPGMPRSIRGPNFNYPLNFPPNVPNMFMNPYFQNHPPPGP